MTVELRSTPVEKDLGVFVDDALKFRDHVSYAVNKALVRVKNDIMMSYGDCAFSVAAPVLWNKLLANIRNSLSLGNFKSLLKTHLFKVAFTDK